MGTKSLLQSALSAAVPMWIEKVHAMSPDERFARAQSCAQYIAEHGDMLLFRGKDGESAAAFNHLAEGIAVLAFAPGGITFADMHFEVIP